jgi:succinate dehydrogenase / fumarate reductase, cytochrome b subunit
MAEARRAVERPLSPHLQVYSLSINMVMSILHRLTGGALYAGTLLLAAWLMSIAVGEKQYAMVNTAFGHPLGKLVLLAYSWALIHHMLGGVRHFIWDSGRGFALWQVSLLSWLTLIGSMTLTIAIWAFATVLRGGM